MYINVEKITPLNYTNTYKYEQIFKTGYTHDNFVYALELQSTKYIVINFLHNIYLTCNYFPRNLIECNLSGPSGWKGAQFQFLFS